MIKTQDSNTTDRCHRVYYWFGVHYDMALLIQACIMIAVQLVLLHVALSNRVLPSASHDLNTPFAPVQRKDRPYNFWQWRSQRPYWAVLLYFTLTMGALQLFAGSDPSYASAIGYIALAVEATLPIPQILSNHRNRSCKGFRVSVLANWLLGDVMKMTFFFLSETSIPWAFKLCGLFQWACDIYLGIQYSQFGNGN